MQEGGVNGLLVRVLLDDTDMTTSNSTTTTPQDTDYAISEAVFWVLNVLFLIFLPLLSFYFWSRVGCLQSNSREDSDAAYRRVIRERRRLEEEAKLENPDQRRKRLEKCFSEAGVVVVLKEEYFQEHTQCPFDEKRIMEHKQRGEQLGTPNNHTTPYPELVETSPPVNNDTNKATADQENTHVQNNDTLAMPTETAATHQPCQTDIEQGNTSVDIDTASFILDASPGPFGDGTDVDGASENGQVKDQVKHDVLLTSIATPSKMVEIPLKDEIDMEQGIHDKDTCSGSVHSEVNEESINSAAIGLPRPPAPVVAVGLDAGENTPASLQRLSRKELRAMSRWSWTSGIFKQSLNRASQPNTDQSGEAGYVEENQDLSVVHNNPEPVHLDPPNKYDASESNKADFDTLDGESGYVRLPGKDYVVPNCCAICLCSYEAKDVVVWSHSCRHVFHQDCMIGWLIKMQDGTSCPCCRQDYIDIPEADPHDVKSIIFPSFNTRAIHFR